MIGVNAAITLLEKRPTIFASEPNFSFSDHFPSRVMAAFVSIITSSFNCYCWTSITMKFIYLSQVLSPLNLKGQPTHNCSHVALIAKLGEHCTGNAKLWVQILFRA